MSKIKNKVLKIFKDERGGSSAIVVLIGTILLIVVLLVGIESAMQSYKHQVLNQANLLAIKAMQINGGLTLDIENKIIDFLEKHNFDRNRLTISGTLAPVSRGTTLELELRYEDTRDVYRISGLITLSKQTENITYITHGSTTSYYFDNN